jgi:hypothetical protein
MILIYWTFIGFICGLFIVSIFNPPFRKIPFIPIPEDNEIYHTKNGGCIKILSEEVECSPDAISLNVIIGNK